MGEADHDARMARIRAASAAAQEAIFNSLEQHGRPRTFISDSIGAAVCAAAVLAISAEISLTDLQKTVDAAFAVVKKL